MRSQPTASARSSTAKLQPRGGGNALCFTQQTTLRQNEKEREDATSGGSRSMPKPPSLAGVLPGALCALFVLVLTSSLFILSEASIQSVTVPLLLGESENRLQGSSGSVPFIKSYNATAHSGVDTTARSSNIVATITPQTQEIRFSDIVIRDLPVDVTAAHIHGPCADATPCSNGPVVYTICSPCPTSSGNTATIPGFTVDLNQLNGNFSTAIGLYQGIMYSNRLYYLNFHTQR